jgi:hypothetical protein
MSVSGAVRAATTLALWSAAWQGGASPDDVLTAIDGADHRAGVRAATDEIAVMTGLPGPGSPTAGSAALLPLLRGAGEAQLLLPYPGDLRGLPTSGELTFTALDTGAAVVLTGSSLAIVPVNGHWRVFGDTARHPADGLAEAHDRLDHEVARATRNLSALDVARQSDGARERVRQLMLAEAVCTPPTMPRPASALLATSISLQALLTVADSHDTGAVNLYQMAAVDDALRPLAIAIREARRAAVAAGVREVSRPADRPPSSRSRAHGSPRRP